MTSIQPPALLMKMSFTDHWEHQKGRSLAHNWTLQHPMDPHCVTLSHEELHAPSREQRALCQTLPWGVGPRGF